MVGAIGFSSEKYIGKVKLEAMAKSDLEFVTLCDIGKTENTKLKSG